jgi:hypothetical protein
MRVSAGHFRPPIAIAAIGCLVGLLSASGSPELRFILAATGAVTANPLLFFSRRLVVSIWRLRTVRIRSLVQLSLFRLFLLVAFSAVLAQLWRTVEPYRRERSEQEQFIAALESLGAPVYAGDRGPSWCRARTVESLMLGDIPIDDEDLAALSLLPGRKHVAHIELRSPYLTDQGFRHLRDFPGLRFLYLQRSTITDEGLQALADTHVRALDLGSTEVTDRSMVFLAQMPKLESISLLGCRGVTDDGLLRLRTPTLKDVEVIGTSVTERGVMLFQRQLPNCKVVHNFGWPPRSARLSTPPPRRWILPRIGRA